ncbi:DUF983 domain-containing protein [Neoroseomonas soli]|uniref:DUF983 domain-containing protein n=1 Tax=Neoroseomonas soli TaxID=1081025 RepID=A0A9X9WTB7_9PROT|nr:DUF983 domain-containing protein [Neoroseomonas soli]MBR0670396.1 DUF983 domain-containing protein [Neoroseomonas soli]
MTKRSRIAEGVRRGLRLRCPQCGEGHLFSGFLKVRPQCERCGSDNGAYPSDDAPPYLTLFLVGHLLLPPMFWLDKAWAPPLWVQFAIWLPLITVVSIALLPFMKGAVVGFAWATGVTRQSARQ